MYFPFGRVKLTYNEHIKGQRLVQLRIIFQTFFQLMPVASRKPRAYSTNVESASKSEPLAQSKGRYMVTLIPGDGVGPELCHSVKRVFR